MLRQSLQTTPTKKAQNLSILRHFIHPTRLGDGLTIFLKFSFNPSAFSLNQNYPNPFNPSTVINYNVDSKTMVRLTVYNSLGQQVKQLVNEVKEPGSYNITFNASNFTSGNYFYRLETDQFSEVKKMILIK